MDFKKKGWVWKLTGPFASSNFTTIWNTIYGPFEPTYSIRKHEQIHSDQQKKWTRLGLPIWIYLYLVGFPIGLPLFWNPWRWKWEWEAYRKGSGYTPEETKRILRGKAYGWLMLHRGGT
jgi:hypothetical protein